MDAAEFRELVFGPREDLAAFFGVSVSQLRRWLGGASPVPAAIARLARARFAGELEAIYGPEAAELRIQGGELIVPGWRRGITLHELRTLWVRIQAIVAAEGRIAMLEAELERALGEAAPQDMDLGLAAQLIARLEAR